MERELLIEIGCEELPASWLPGLTRQMRDGLQQALESQRLSADAPIESYSTPRRLTGRIAKIAERQTDLEELITGPPVSAGFGPDGQPTQAAIGFARKNSVEVSVLERVETPRGTYLAYRLHQRGKTAVDVLPDVLGATLRAFSFPKAMRWDAVLDDGRGDLPFGRPIRWILYLYGGRVVPFAIRRSEQAESALVQEIHSAAVTYGHRFLTTTGRAGRAVKVRTFEDYQARLLEHFVILERQERQDRITRGLEAKARSLGGRVSSAAAHHSTLLEEVPDLIEYPSVIAGTFSPEFLTLPEEVLTTTMIHHQHNFPVVDDAGRLKAAFLAVTNTDTSNEQVIARNAERVLTARLRDARFFWDADRKVRLEDRLPRLETIRFHKKLGSYRDKAKRVGNLARWVAAEALGVPELAEDAARAGRLAKADLATEMVAELTELQGTMGGIYAREEGLPETVWKAIYYHYLPTGVEADAPPNRQQLGAAAVTWVAASVADKLDTVVGMFWAGEWPTGSRDPYGLRRMGQGIIKILVDLQSLTGLNHALALNRPVDKALEGYGQKRNLGPVTPETEWSLRLGYFFAERLRHLLEQRGAKYDEVNAVVSLHSSLDELRPLRALQAANALREVRRTQEFTAVAELFKRIKNISKDIKFTTTWGDLLNYAHKESREDAERMLIERVAPLVTIIQNAWVQGELAVALRRISDFQPQVALFFEKVLVMSEDERIREYRLQLMAGFRDLVMSIADISEIVPSQDVYIPWPPLQK